MSDHHKDFANDGFAPVRLDQFLRLMIPTLSGEMTLDRIGGGQSNPTYFVTYDNRRLVLRKQPAGPLLPSAHAIDREYRVMKQLGTTDVPVPSLVFYCDDVDVIGTPFYVMERLEGRVFSDCSLPDVSAYERNAMYLSMAETLAQLHRVDWKACGLSDYGSQGEYYSRQIARWTRQWNLSKTRKVPEIDYLAAWLPMAIPDNSTVAISHGDFRIGNLMFHPTEPRVVGILDWELSSLGDPMADLSYSALGWYLFPDEYMGMRGADLDALGIPSERDYLAHYFSVAGIEPRIATFHYAFSLFRLAVIAEGIAARAISGASVSENARDVGKLSVNFARRAMEIIDGEGIA
ncbi:phosphotransferase family protein [Noviherbaspirillum saxi]|uniref:Phosphotransferase family protein n=1 Tax=Noviherbaspirillum saxi TaxID=2320863 RepID=A0A3A3FHE0_9BURK|nr:phosphotransferase family protein [Noviherbaspirillum saxi]RJF92801.1 phosphotransferase family protein [Noviherbaspirillum saxi]